MKQDIFAQVKAKIMKRVSERRLRDVFSEARSLAETMMNWEASDTLSRAEDTYRQMLRYVNLGDGDPHRDSFAAQLGETVLGVVDGLERQNLKDDTPTLYYNNVRYEETRPADDTVRLLDEYRALIGGRQLFDMVSVNRNAPDYINGLKRREELERRIFTRVWIAFPLSAADAEALDAALASDVTPDYFKQLLVWALMLGALQYFDPRRIEVLALAYMNSTARVSAAAAVALVLALYAGRRRTLSPKAAAKLGALHDLPQWQTDLRLIYMELTRTRDTDRITAKIRDEVVPEMMKLRPEISRRFSTDLPTDPAELEENPEWHDLLEKSGVGEKLKEMSEIQEEGGDVMMGTFSHLKSFPFFHDVANWFLPFHTDRSEFTGGVTGAETFADLLTDMPVLCDSDKYSMMLTMLMAPAAQREMMLSQLNAQQDAIAQLRAASLDTRVTDRRAVINKLVQNLFRFFRLYRRKGEFPNPFDGALILSDVAWLKPEIDDPELLNLVAEFYFSHGYYAEALEAYRHLAALQAPTAYVYQKMGYAHQKLGDPAQAVANYEKSEMLDPGSAWTLRLLARCYMQLGEYGRAVEALTRLEAIKPDVVNNALMLGHSYVALADYDNAARAYFKAEYLGARPEKVLRHLAWALLMKHDYQRAREYYEKAIRDTGARDEDFLNLGHLNLAENRYQEALQSYRRNIEQRMASSSLSRHDAIERFITDFKTDTPALATLGIDTSVIPMIIDSILYSF